MDTTCPSNGKPFVHYIFVTGGAGFLGSHLVIYLVKNYPTYFIINFDKLNYCSSLVPLKSIEDEPNYKFVEGDICDPKKVTEIFKEYNVDIVLHLAAESHVDLSFFNPLDFSLTNVYGTHVLTHVANEYHVKLFVHMSTDEVYGGDCSEETLEETIFQPSNPYAATKAAAECIVMSYWRSYQLPVIVVRANNIYGPHQYPDKVIPKFISLLQRDRSCCIHGNGATIRNFIYVDDVIKGIDILLHKGTPGEVYNIGSKIGISILELARYLIRKVKNIEEPEEINKYISFGTDRIYNDTQYIIGTNKISQLGWKLKIDWENGISKTIDWYQKNFSNWEGAESALSPFPKSLC